MTRCWRQRLGDQKRNFVVYEKGGEGELCKGLKGRLEEKEEMEKQTGRYEEEQRRKGEKKGINEEGTG